MNLIVLNLLLFNLVLASHQKENVTLFHRKNVFLSRQKRYVQWPKGSNFVVSGLTKFLIF